MFTWFKKIPAAPLNDSANDAQALLNLGQTLIQQGRHAEAEPHLNNAILIDPNLASAFYLLGAIAQQRGSLGAAEEMYQKALAIKPDFAKAHSNLGIVFHMQGRLDQAMECYQKTILFKPDFAEAHGNLAALFQAQGRLAEAIESCRKALSIKPDDASFHYNLGLALQTNGDTAAAADCYRKTIERQPDYVEAHLNLGVVLQAQDQAEQAIAMYRSAVALAPEFATAHYNLAHALEDRGELAEAIRHYRQALVCRPDYAEAHCNLGIALRKDGQLDTAIESYQAALALKPDYAEAFNNMAAALQAQGKTDLALACCAKALQINPDLADAHWNEAVFRLQIGDFSTGLKKYEWRWKIDALKKHQRNFTQALWLGKQPLQGKTILLHAEQGLGDAIQFCRYARLVAAQGATVLLEIPESLGGLMAGLEGIERIIIRGESLPSFDFHCPLLSLPLAFNTQLHTIPDDSPYLACNPVDAAVWASRLGPTRLPRIGLVWSGNWLHQNDSNRSIALAEMMQLVSGKAEFIGLQKEVRAADRAILAAHPEIRHAGETLQNFSDAAALVANLDLVISVDTSVAHLAGAMGKPFWLLLPFNPDWRWMLERSDSPWYCSATLFRQTHIGDWADVIATVAGEIDKLVSTNTA